eukprot:scaffold468273_cov16-Prasinocladus_malaysianus.AAC.1
MHSQIKLIISGAVYQQHAKGRTRRPQVAKVFSECQCDNDKKISVQSAGIAYLLKTYGNQRKDIKDAS